MLTALVSFHMLRAGRSRGSKKARLFAPKIWEIDAKTTTVRHGKVYSCDAIPPPMTPRPSMTPVRALPGSGSVPAHTLASRTHPMQEALSIPPVRRLVSPLILLCRNGYYALACELGGSGLSPVVDITASALT